MDQLNGEFFGLCQSKGLIREPFLEVGSARVLAGVPNLCDLARGGGLQQVVGADIASGPGVDIVHDFESVPSPPLAGGFATVAIFNVLEHTFNPEQVLANALTCVRANGSLIVSVPANWPIHNFPGDYCRLMPNWFEEFGNRWRIQLVEDSFVWQSLFGILAVKSLKRPNGEYMFPNFTSVGFKRAPIRTVTSKIIHRIGFTFGRTHWNPNSSIGVAYRTASGVR
jgi:SAM-dependent methyltransferase